MNFAIPDLAPYIDAISVVMGVAVFFAAALAGLGLGIFVDNWGGRRRG